MTWKRRGNVLLWGLLWLAGCHGRKVSLRIEASIEAPTSPIAFTQDALDELPAQMTLRNSGNVAVAVSAFADTNITVQRINCGDVDLVPHEGVVFPFTPPSDLATAGLQELAVGQSVKVPLPGIRTVSESGGMVSLATYQVPRTAACIVTLRYAYQGPANGYKKVFRGPIDLAPITVSFR